MSLDEVLANNYLASLDKEAIILLISWLRKKHNITLEEL